MGNREPPLFRVKNKPRLEPAAGIHNASIYEGNSQTPLLRLPREIRDEIWGLVVAAGGMIHLEHRVFRESHLTGSSQRQQHLDCLRHRVCTSKDPNQGFEVSCLASPVTAKPLPLPFVNLVTLPVACIWHNEVLKSRPTTKYRENHRVHRFDLGFLLTCRQLYIEATPILYAENLFSTRSLDVLGDFLLSRNELQKQSLRKLRIDMEAWCFFDPWATAHSKMALVVENLHSLKTLYIRVLGLPGGGLLKILSRLRVIDLEKVVITIDESTESAEKLQQMLLDPNGAELQRLEDDENRAAARLKANSYYRRRKEQDEKERLDLLRRESAKLEAEKDVMARSRSATKRLKRTGRAGLRSWARGSAAS